MTRDDGADRDGRFTDPDPGAGSGPEDPADPAGPAARAWASGWEDVPPPAAPGALARLLTAEVTCSDTGNARRFARLFRDDVRYVRDRRQWLVREAVRWRPDVGDLTVFALTAEVVRELRDEALRIGDDDDARDRLLRFALASESEGARRRTLSTAPGDHPALCVSEEDLDPDPELLACADGLIDLRTGELRPARPEDLVTRVVTAGYDPAEAGGSVLLDEFLATFIPDRADQDVVFACLGTCLRAGNPARVLPIIRGGTTSGKSTLATAVLDLLGEYGAPAGSSIFRGNLDDRPRPDLVDVVDRRLVVAFEAAQTWELHGDQAKRLTGGDPIPLRDLYSQVVRRTPRFTPLIVTNEMPRIRGADDALRRRLVVIPMNRTLPTGTEDARHKARFLADPGVRRALLRRLVEGARSPLFRDGIRWDLLPESCATFTAESFGDLDHVGSFVTWLRDSGLLVDAPGLATSRCAQASEVHRWYGEWLRRHGDRRDNADKLNLAGLGAALRSAGWTSRRSGGIRWVGVQLTASVDPWSGGHGSGASDASEVDVG